MVTFRCKRSGNEINVRDEMAIRELRQHESYSEVKHEEVRKEIVGGGCHAAENVQIEDAKAPDWLKVNGSDEEGNGQEKVLKRPGRPRKTH